LSVSSTGASISVFRNISIAGSINLNSFAAKVDIIFGTSLISSLAVGDFDGDSKPDLAGLDYNSNKVSIVRNKSNIGSIDLNSFSTSVEFLTEINPVSLAINDLDGDSKPDLAVVSSSSTVVSIFRNTDITLPVTITNFKAFQKNTDIQVAWDTKNEINLQAYEVEKSRDGVSFSKVGIVVANGSSSYTWLDVNPTNGNNYYRLKMIDNDGSFKYSAIVNVKIGGIKNQITIANNPIRIKTLVLQIENMVKDNLTILLYNNSGQKILQKSMNHSGGSATQTVNLGNLVTGTYQLSIIGKDVKFNKTIIVE